MASSRRRRFIQQATLIYVVFAAAWIFFSDRLLMLISDVETISRFSILKGFAFIAFTASMFWIVMHNTPEEQSSPVFDEPAEPVGALKLTIALLIPVATAWLQWEMWEAIQPYAWFLFFPAVYFSSRIGGLPGGIGASVLSTLIVWYVFMPPQFSFAVERPFAMVTIGIFFATGIVITLSHERLRITERRAAEAIFRPLVEQSLAGIYIIQDGKFKYVNPHFAQIHGYTSAAQMIGLDVMQAVAPEDRARVESFVQERIEKRVNEIEYAFHAVRCDGSPAYFEVHGRSYTYRGRPAVIGLLLDVTERHHAEAEIRRQKQLLDRMSRVAKVGGWGYDVATHTISWTEEVAHIHDVSVGEPISVEKGLSFFHGDASQIVRTAFGELVEHGQPYDLEVEMVSAKGVKKWVRIQAEPVLEEGKVVRVEGAFQDITDRKIARLELLRLYAELEDRVALRTAELAAANHELDAFAYAVSHDLRAPLRAMSGFSHALLEDHGEELSAGARDYLDEITRASRKMGELIDGLLRLSRSVRSEIRRDQVDLSAMAEMLTLELAAAEPERVVTTDIQPGIVVQGDARTLEIALRNLLSNAWKYTAKTEHPHVAVKAETIDGRCWIRVEDNGAGFDEAYSARLFQPFQRLHRQDEFPGLGIGLATVQRIVQRHGGQIHANSRPGQGATFSFYIPS